MSMNELLSVIVPIYKIEKYLPQCIESILGQTYKNLEIILVDDGSPDLCPLICDEYAGQDNRIHVIHKKNGGLVSARQAGITYAHGSYITYVDGDDWLDAAFYEKLMKVILAHNADMVIAGYTSEKQEGNKTVINMLKAGLYTGESLKNEFIPYMIYTDRFFESGMIPAVWNKIFRREVLIPNQLNIPKQICMGEDSVCTYPAILSSKKVFVSEECGYHYRQTGNSMVTSYDPFYFDKLYILMNYFTKIIQDKNGNNLDNQLTAYYLFLIKLGLGQELGRKNRICFVKRYKRLKGILQEAAIKDVLERYQDIKMDKEDSIFFRMAVRGSVIGLCTWKIKMRLKWKRKQRLI